MTPRTFPQTIDSLRDGQLSDELTKALVNLTAACAETGRAGTLTLTLQLKPGKGGQIEVFDDVRMKPPKQDRGSSLMFAAADNTLTRDDPRQQQIDGLRTLDQETVELRRIAQQS